MIHRRSETPLPWWEGLGEGARSATQNYLQERSSYNSFFSQFVVVFLLKTNVNIQIKYLVTLRDRTGKREEQVNFPQGSTLQDVADWLKTRYGISVPNPHIMATLNGRGWEQLPQKLSTEIRDGDVICLFPPIGGG